VNDRSWITAKIGAPAFERLARELTGSELHSVLHEVMRARAAARTPADVLAQYARDRFCEPALVDPVAGLAIDRHFFAAAHEFTAVELSPVAPLGTTSTLGPTGQHRVLSALRMCEVVSDPTDVMALESASRLRARPDTPVHLATSQRVVRAQPAPRLPGYAQHFRMFALTSAGRETADHGFTVDAIVRHVDTMRRALDRLEQDGYAFGTPRVEVLTVPGRDAVAARVAERLRGTVTRKALDHPYYSGGVRYQIWVTAPDGSELPLIDGGTFDWLAKLTSNQRASFVASGTGTQLVALRFRSA
jgi:hypothetical protein